MWMFPSLELSWYLVESHLCDGLVSSSHLQDVFELRASEEQVMLKCAIYSPQVKLQVLAMDVVSGVSLFFRKLAWQTSFR